jgi:hypothetical protein
LHEVQRRVARADDGDGARGERRAVVGGEVVSGAEGLEGGENRWPSRGAVGFEVDEEIEGLC